MDHARSPRSRARSALSRGIAAAMAAGSMASVWSNARAQELEEIIVTAERRELSLQQTPISVVAFTGESLDLRGVRDMFRKDGLLRGAA